METNTKIHYLMIKEYITTGQKYLCVRSASNIQNAIKYKGSGLHIKRIIKKYGKDVIRHHSILFETPDKTELSKKGIYYSELYNIVESDDWLNMIPENGYGGSVNNPNKGRIVINNTITHKYINPEELKIYLDNGWIRGVSQKLKEKLSNVSRGRPSWKKGLKMKLSHEYKSTTGNYRTRKSEEEKYINRCIASKEVMSRTYIREWSRLRATKPPISLINSCGKIETRLRSEWIKILGSRCTRLWKTTKIISIYKGWKLYNQL